MLRNVPDDWGPKFDGESGAVTHTQTGPNEIAFKAPAHMALVMFTPQPGRELALNSDRKAQALAPMGAIEVVPADAELFARWRAEKENLLVAFDPARLARISGLEFDKEDFEFQPPKLGFVDDRALFLANLLREELLSGAAVNELYIDSLITVFGTHLLRNYSTLSVRAERTPIGGLPPKAWRNVDDHIRANLDQRLSITQLALVARRSPGYFLRAFRETCGQTPHQYIIMLRLALAERLLTTTELPFSEVAKKAGFWSNSHMSATMKRTRGTMPKELRQSAGNTE